MLGDSPLPELQITYSHKLIEHLLELLAALGQVSSRKFVVSLARSKHRIDLDYVPELSKQVRIGLILLAQRRAGAADSLVEMVRFGCAYLFQPEFLPKKK